MPPDELGIVNAGTTTLVLNVLAPAILWVPDVLTTVLSTSMTPLAKSIPSPPVICALTSEALGPVYVNTPLVLLYDKLPSPPVSVTLKVASTAVVKSVICVCGIAMFSFAAAVNCPCAFTVNVGIAVALP